MDGEHGLRPLGDGLVYPRRLHEEGLGIDVDENGSSARQLDDVRRRREGVRRHDHFVTGPDAEREHRQVESRGSGRNGGSVADAAGGGEPGLELRDLGPHRELPTREHFRDGRHLGVAHVRPREPDLV